MLKYQAPRSIATGVDADLSVRVTDLGRHAESSALPRYHGWVVYPDDAPVADPDQSGKTPTAPSSA